MKSLAVWLVAMCVAVPAPASAQDVRERTLKFAHQNTREHPQGQGVAKFAELVAQKSGGRMKVEQLAGDQRGDLAMLSAVQSGGVDMTVMNVGLLSGVVREAALVDLPFLFNDAREADAVMDGAFGKKLAERIGERNLVLLGYWDLGFRDVTNSKRPIVSLADFAGLRLRVVQSPVIVDTFKALGANPTPMPFPEVYRALEQKTVDGQENPLTVIVDQKFAAVQPYLTLTHHVYNPQALLIGRRTWDALNAAERRIVEEAAAEATKFQRQAAGEAAAAALEQLRKDGVKVNELAPSEVAAARARVKPVVEKYSAQAGAAMSTLLQSEIVRARK